jgi:hypothetical protein
MIDYNFVPETLEWCTKHYVPPIKPYIICPDFGNCDGMNGACWHCMEMTPYQHEMCHDEWNVRSYMSPFNKYHVDTREEAAELVEKYKQEHPHKNIIEYLYYLHKEYQEEKENTKCKD